jgi:hypothetical protein
VLTIAQQHRPVDSDDLTHLLSAVVDNAEEREPGEGDIGGPWVDITLAGFEYRRMRDLVDAWWPDWVARQDQN